MLRYDLVITNLLCKLVLMILKQTSDLRNNSEKSGFLVLKLDGIGDLVLSSAFMRELKRNFPDEQITLVCNPLLFSLAKNCPHVDEVMVYRSPKRWRPRLLFCMLHATFWGLCSFKGKSFRAAVVPRTGADISGATALALCSGTRQRIAFTEMSWENKQLYNRGYDRFYTDLLQRAAGEHETPALLRLLGPLGGKAQSDDLELWLGEDSIKAARDLLRGFYERGDSSGLICLCPFGSAPRRDWPLDRYAAVIEKALAQHSSIKVVIIGGASVGSQCEAVAEALAPRVLSLAGKSTVDQVAAVIDESDVYLGADTGPMHIAAACGKPVVEISCHPEVALVDHVNSPSCFGPWKARSIILQPQAPRDMCRNGCEMNEPHCILQISVDEVYEKLNQVLHEEI